jgi:hypothetical protein
MAAFLRHEKDILQELCLQTDPDEACSSHSDRDLDTDMTLLLQMGAKFMFVQGCRTLGILVVSILSLMVLVD